MEGGSNGWLRCGEAAAQNRNVQHQASTAGGPRPVWRENAGGPLNDAMGDENPNIYPKPVAVVRETHRRHKDWSTAPTTVKTTLIAMQQRLRGAAAGLITGAAATLCYSQGLKVDMLDKQRPLRPPIPGRHEIEDPLLGKYKLREAGGPP